MKPPKVTPEAFAAYQKEMARIEEQYTRELEAADVAYLERANIALQVMLHQSKRGTT